MDKKNIVLVLAVIIGIFLIAGSIYQKKNRDNSNTNNAAISSTPNTHPDNISEWKTVRNEEMGFTIKHPEHVKSMQEPGSGSFIYLGPTQTQGTELYDGLALTFNGHVYPQGNQVLKDFVDKQIASDSQHGTVSLSSEITINGRQGLTYTLEGVGTFKIIILPNGSDKVLMISSIVADPNNGGYQQIVDQMLSSLEIVND